MELILEKQSLCDALWCFYGAELVKGRKLVFGWKRYWKKFWYSVVRNSG
jgi:hypothetical protein